MTDVKDSSKDDILAGVERFVALSEPLVQGEMVIIAVHSIFDPSVQW